MVRAHLNILDLQRTATWTYSKTVEVTDTFIIAALVGAALSGCSTSREQPPLRTPTPMLPRPRRRPQPVAKKAKAKPR